MLGHSGTAGKRALSPDPYLLAHLRVSELHAMRRLGQELEAIGRDIAAARLKLYRRYVGSTVTRVSPLLTRWCALEGVCADALAWRLAPDRPWCTWLCGRRPPDPTRPVKRWGPAPFASAGEIALHQLARFAFSGTVVSPRARTDGFGVRVLHEQLELGAFLGSAHLRTIGSGGTLFLPDELPATLVAGLTGVPLDRLIDHPLLNGAGCIIRGVDEPTRLGTRIRFGLSPEAWRMPWVTGEE